jgi:hypothetical protein
MLPYLLPPALLKKNMKITGIEGKIILFVGLCNLSSGMINKINFFLLPRRGKAATLI